MIWWNVKFQCVRALRTTEPYDNHLKKKKNEKNEMSKEKTLPTERAVAPRPVK